ncbi:MAG: amidinotransferase [Candidatus Xenobiia bacterium LiM19]
MSNQPIMVHHEWGRLREVVVGFPYLRMGTQIPRYAHNFMNAETLEMAKTFIRETPVTLTDAHSELYQKTVLQMDRAISILRELGVIVHQLKPYEPAEEAYLVDISMGHSQLYFPRDPMLVIGNTFIDTAMFHPMRRKERFPVRRAIGNRLRNGGARITSIPEPFPHPEERDGGYGPGPFLEGGDVFVLGRTIYVGNSGNASNTAGIQSLRDILGPEYSVNEVRFSRKFLHLDCILSTPRPGLAIVCREGFLDGLPAFLEGWKLIEVSAEDAEKKLAANGLVIDEKTILVAEELPELADALSRAGQNVITTPFDGIFAWGGAFRCWHHPLVRESDRDEKL